jgi:hypothetical protein
MHKDPKLIFRDDPESLDSYFSNQNQITALQASLVDREHKLRQRTGTFLQEHHLIKDFHIYRESKKVEVAACIRSFREQHLFKRGLQSKNNLSWSASEEGELEKAKKENKQLKLDCFRLQKLLMKAQNSKASSSPR